MPGELDRDTNPPGAQDAEPESPEALALVSRDKIRSRRARAVRAKVESTNRMTYGARRKVSLELLQDGTDHAMPVDRRDCASGPRPCPLVRCKWNLYLDVKAETRAIKFNFPDLEPEAMPPAGSCALDVADEGGKTLEEVGALMNVTRERIRQYEVMAFRRIRSVFSPEEAREFAEGLAELPERRQSPLERMAAENAEGTNSKSGTSGREHNQRQDARHMNARDWAEVDRWVNEISHAVLFEGTPILVAQALANEPLEGPEGEPASRTERGFPGESSGLSEDVDPDAPADVWGVSESDGTRVPSVEAARHLPVERIAKMGVPLSPKTIEIRARILEYLRQHGPSPWRTMTHALGLPEHAMHNNVAFLKTDGKIELRGTRPSARWALVGDERSPSVPVGRQPPKPKIPELKPVLVTVPNGNDVKREYAGADIDIVLALRTRREKALVDAAKFAEALRALGVDIDV